MHNYNNRYKREILMHIPSYKKYSTFHSTPESRLRFYGSAECVDGSFMSIFAFVFVFMFMFRLDIGCWILKA